MDLQLTGKLALVSGSTAGIGYAIARTLAQEGAAIIAMGGHMTDRPLNTIKLRRPQHRFAQRSAPHQTTACTLARSWTGR